MSNFSKCGHLEWRSELSDMILKGSIPARFDLIWFQKRLFSNDICHNQS